jgi:CheY-like chemotaxis protein
MPALADIRLLIIEDDPAGRLALSDALKRRMAGSTVDIVSSAVEGLARLSAHRYDCVLCDLLMPDMDGLGFLSASRKRFPSLAVILTTAADLPVRQQALEAGAFAFLPKPLNIEMVVNTVQQAAAWTRRHERGSV